MTKVDIWWCGLDDAARLAAGYSPILTPDELARAGRFAFERLRHNFIVGRGVTRIILAERLGCPPESIRFESAARGKPRVVGAPFYFNVSHSGDMIVCGIADDWEIGVDVEKIQARTERKTDSEAIAKRFFSPAEAAHLASIPAAARERAFFDCWTRKEAFLKATGEGLFRALDSFEVAFGPGVPPRFLRIDGDDPNRWRLHAFEPSPGYTGALAMAAVPDQINVREFQA